MLNLKLLSFVYDSVNRLPPLTFTSSTILSDVHQYDTWQACEGGSFMTLPKTLQYGARSVRYAGANYWNNIPFYISPSDKFLWSNENDSFSLPNINPESLTRNS